MLKVPRAESPGECAFALHCRVERLYPEREFLFASPRKWRFDFCFPQHKLAVEIDGGIWQAGRHSRATGFENDCRKLNMAAKLGYRVLRYSTAMVLAGDAINDTLEVLRG